MNCAEPAQRRLHFLRWEMLPAFKMERRSPDPLGYFAANDKIGDPEGAD